MRFQAEYLRGLFRNIGQATFPSPSSPTPFSIDQASASLDDITDDSAIHLKSLVTALRDNGLNYKKITALSEQLTVRTAEADV